MTTVYPAVPSGCVDTHALLQALVSFLDDHAYIAPWKSSGTMSPKVLQVVEGPRTDAWMSSNAPLVAVTYLREEEESAAAQNTEHDLVFYFQILIATLGGSPEEADKIALRLSDTIRYCFRGSGARIGDPGIGTGNAVVLSRFVGSGWDVEQRRDPTMAVYLRNLAVDVIER